MGVYTTFHAVLGVVIPDAVMFEKYPRTVVRVPSCKHDDMDRVGTYCATCGVKVQTYDESRISKEEDAISDYLQARSVVRMQDPKTTRDIAWLIGVGVHMSRDSEQTHRQIAINPLDIEAATHRINSILADAPHPLGIEYSPMSIRLHVYMDHR